MGKNVVGCRGLVDGTRGVLVVLGMGVIGCHDEEQGENRERYDVMVLVGTSNHKVIKII